MRVSNKAKKTTCLKFLNTLFAVAGTIQSRQDAVDYMTWTYFFRRLVQNPSYYGLEGVGQADMNSFLTGLVGKSLDELELSYCLERDEDGRGVYATVLGRIASYYYLAHQTVQHFRDSLRPDMTSAQVLQVRTKGLFKFRECFFQCCEAATFLCGSGSGRPESATAKKGRLRLQTLKFFS